MGSHTSPNTMRMDNGRSAVAPIMKVDTESVDNSANEERQLLVSASMQNDTGF